MERERERGLLKLEIVLFLNIRIFPYISSDLPQLGICCGVGELSPVHAG